jgi:hypothetical protein
MPFARGRVARPKTGHAEQLTAIRIARRCWLVSVALPRNDPSRTRL